MLLSVNGLVLPPSHPRTTPVAESLGLESSIFDPVSRNHQGHKHKPVIVHSPEPHSQPVLVSQPHVLDRWCVFWQGQVGISEINQFNSFSCSQKIDPCMNQPCFRHRLDFNRCTKKSVAKNPYWKPVFGTQSPFHFEDWYSDSLKPVCQQSFKGLHLHRIVSQSQDVLGKNSITEMLPFCHHEWCIFVAINRNSFERLFGVPQHLGSSIDPCMNQPCFRHWLDFNRCTKKLGAKNLHWEPEFLTQSPFHAEDWYSNSSKLVWEQSFKELHLHRIESQSLDFLGKNLITKKLPFCQHDWCISVAINRNSFESLFGVPQHLGLLNFNLASVTNEGQKLDPRKSPNEAPKPAFWTRNLGLAGVRCPQTKLERHLEIQHLGSSVDPCMNQPCFRHWLDFNRCTKKVVAENLHWEPEFLTQSPFHVEDWYSDSLKPVCEQSFKGFLHRMLPFCQNEWCISEAISRNSFENLSGVPQHLGPSVSVLPMIVIVELDISRVHWDMIGTNPNYIVGVGILVCSLPQNCAFLKHSVAFDWFWHCYVLLLNSFCFNRFLHDFFASLLCRSSIFHGGTEVSVLDRRPHVLDRWCVDCLIRKTQVPSSVCRFFGWCIGLQSRGRPCAIHGRSCHSSQVFFTKFPFSLDQVWSRSTFRFGEALHPGPLCIGTFNPAQMLGHSNTILQWGKGIWAASETSHTADAQKIVTNQMRKGHFHSVWSKPVATHSNNAGSLRGKASGCAIFSHLKLVDYPIPMNQLVTASSRMIDAVVEIHGSCHLYIASIYGPTHGNTFSDPWALLNALVDSAFERAKAFRGPALVVGDFNMEVSKIAAWKDMQNHGWVDVAQLVAEAKGISPDPTCRHGARRSFILANQVAVRALLDCEVADTFDFDAHPLLKATFDLEEISSPRWIWNLPKSTDDLMFDHELLDHFANVAVEQRNNLFTKACNDCDGEEMLRQINLAFEFSLSKSCVDAIGNTKKFPNACLGRGRKPLKKLVPSNDPVIRKGRNGEFSPDLCQASIFVRRRVKQFRRLQSLEQQLRGKQSENQIHHQCQALWKTILQAHSFQGGFQSWVLQTFGIFVPSDCPQLDYIKYLVKRFKADLDEILREHKFRSLKIAQDMQRLDIQKGGPRAYQKVRDASFPPFQCIKREVSCTFKLQKWPKEGKNVSNLSMTIPFLTLTTRSLFKANMLLL